MLASISRKIVNLVDNHHNQFAGWNNIWLALVAKVGSLRAKGFKLAFPKKDKFCHLTAFTRSLLMILGIQNLFAPPIPTLVIFWSEPAIIEVCLFGEHFIAIIGS